jgi:leucyl/phenylalanyl-tRNA--protein transferase
MDDRSIVETLLDAYREGLFPMADGPHGPVHFYSADPRGVMPLTEAEGLHVPRSVERAARARGFRVRSDTAFEPVVRGCMESRRGEDAWITEELIALYRPLHAAGHAHSVEAWLEDPADGAEALVGGVYGVSIGAAFFAESMFHLPRPRRAGGSRDPLDGTDASKVCLVRLIEHLRALGYRLLDIQMVTEHTGRFGAVEIPEREFRSRLRAAAAGPDRWRPIAP